MGTTTSLLVQSTLGTTGPVGGAIGGMTGGATGGTIGGSTGATIGGPTLSQHSSILSANGQIPALVKV